MISFLVCSLLTLLVFSRPGFSAQSPAPAQSLGTTTIKGRYLIVVETSKAMERRGLGALEGVRELLFTNMRGQLRDGDTIGMWTFNEQIQTGKFPLQQWSAKNARQVATRALDFLQSQRFEKESGLQNVLAAMHGVVSNSEFITIALVTTGNEYVSGTPFDSAINQTFKNWQDGQQKKQMPMVTILRARKGRYTDFTVTPLPFPIEIPPFPADLQVVSAPKPVQTNKSVAAPLIVTGPKRQQAETVAPTTAPQTPVVSNLIFRGSDNARSVQAAPATPVERPPATIAAPPLTSTPGAVQDTLVPQPTKLSSTTENSTAPGTATEQKPTAAEPTEASSKPPVAELASTPGSPQGQPTSDSGSNVTNTSGSAQTAVATPAAPMQSRGVARVASLGAAVAALGVLLLWLFLRRSPPAHRSSLITRSLEKEQK